MNAVEREPGVPGKDAPLRIALLASTAFPHIGGAEVVVHRLAESLSALGHHVRVLTWWGLWRRFRGTRAYRVLPFLPASFTAAHRTCLMNGHPAPNRVAAQAVGYQVLKTFDVWNVHVAYPLGTLAAAALQARGVPVVATSHGGDLMKVPSIAHGVRLNPHLDVLIQDCFRRADACTAISRRIHGELRAIDIPEPRITDVANGVDVQRIRQQAVNRAEVRQRLGVRDDELLLITVGRNHGQKNYRSLADVAARLRQAGVRFKWAVVGQELEAHRPALREKGIEDCVHLIAPMTPSFSQGSRQGIQTPTPDLVALLKSSDIYVSLALFEGLPLTWLEGMAAGLPVVGYAVVEEGEITRSGENGFLVPLEDREELVRCIARLSGDHPLRARMAEAARADAGAFDWPVVARCYERVFRRVIAARAADATR